MIEKITQFFKDKKIIILGFGVEGKSTYNFIRRYLPEIPLVVRYSETDFDEEDKYLNEDKNLKFITGDKYLEGIQEYDIIMKSPGISFKNIDLSKFKDKITSQLELFLENNKSLCIGITGTKGKSTTSSLIYKIIEDQGKNVELLGNIGVPIFDEIEKIKENTITVLEISSHALQYVKKSPNISILLNLFEEHLDHYKSFEEYGDAKFNIFKFQKENDIAIFNLDNENMRPKEYPYKKTDYAVTMSNNLNNITDNTVYLKDEYIWINDKKVYNMREDRKLKGKHNLNNIMFVLTISKILNLNLEDTVKSINEFNPLEHRLEYVGVFENVEYYNDSIATIPEATIESIKALENVNTLIVGGNDRGVNHENLIRFLETSVVENILCLPKTGEYIYEGLKKSKKKVIKVADLEEAVDLAKHLTKKNTICLLSPSASSYGYFKNFKERGNIFKKMVIGDSPKRALMSQKGHILKGVEMNQFLRTEMLIGEKNLLKLKKSKVAIFGIGGVGSYVAEGLARCGIENFVLVDNDKVSETNINRQIIATTKTIGEYKVELMKQRILDINPNAKVETYKTFYMPDSGEEILDSSINYIVDAIDTVTAKIYLVEQATKLNIPIISSMGTGNKLDPTKFEITDIYKTSVCPLAKVMRKELKLRNIKNLKVLYSKEEPLKPEQDTEEHISKKQIPGSVSFVPSVAGLIIGGEVVKDLMNMGVTNENI